MQFYTITYKINATGDEKSTDLSADTPEKAAKRAKGFFQKDAITIVSVTPVPPTEHGGQPAPASKGRGKAAKTVTASVADVILSTPPQDTVVGAAQDAREFIQKVKDSSSPARRSVVVYRTLAKLHKNPSQNYAHQEGGPVYGHGLHTAVCKVDDVTGELLTIIWTHPHVVVVIDGKYTTVAVYDTLDAYHAQWRQAHEGQQVSPDAGGEE